MTAETVHGGCEHLAIQILRQWFMETVRFVVLVAVML